MAVGINRPNKETKVFLTSAIAGVSLHPLVLFTSVPSWQLQRLLKNWYFMAKYETPSTVQYKLSMVLFSRGLPHSFILVFEVHLQNILPSGCGEKTMPCEGQRECAAALAARRRVEKAFEACRSEEDESPGPAHCDIITTQLPLQHKEA